MNNIKHKISNGIYIISLGSIVEYVLQDNSTKNVNSESYQFLRLLSDQVCAIHEEESTDKIEEFGDFSFELDFNPLKNGFKINDHLFSIPAMSYILFQWLNVARNEERWDECKRLWELIHSLTFDSIFFKLPTSPITS